MYACGFNKQVLFRYSAILMSLASLLQIGFDVFGYNPAKHLCSTVIKMAEVKKQAQIIHFWVLARHNAVKRDVIMLQLST